MQKRLTKSDLMSSIHIAGYVERIDDNCDSYLYTKEHGSSLLEIYRRGKAPGGTISQFVIYVTFYQASEIICCIYFTNILITVSDICRLDINRNLGLILNQTIITNLWLQNIFQETKKNLRKKLLK